MNTLIIVDVQNDFMPGGALEVKNADKIIPVINNISNQFDLVVATQDWHPKNHTSFASNHPDKKPFEKMVIQGKEETLWPDHCVQGSQGAEFYPDLNTNIIAAIFRKGMNPEVDSYSGFYDNHHQISTGLSGYLREKGASTLYFCGLATDICVYFTIKDALSEGFSAVLIEDAAQPLDNETYKQLKKELIQSGVSVIQSSSIINRD